MKPRNSVGGLDTASRILGPEHPTTVLEMGNLALILQERKQYQQAERLQRQVVAISRRTLGAEPFNTTVAMDHLAEVLHLEGRDAESGALFHQTAEVQRRTLGPDHRYTLSTLYHLAWVVATEHRHDEALLVLRDLVNKGFASAGDLESDPDFRTLRGDSRFKTLVAEAKLRDAVVVKTH